MTYGVVRAFQVIVNTFLCSPEKAGVGGSCRTHAQVTNSLRTQADNARPSSFAKQLRNGNDRSAD